MTAAVDAFCSAGFRDHATDAAAVFARLPEGVPLVEEARDLPQLAGLIVHVAGEHMGKWHEGLALLAILRASSHFDAGTPEGKAVLRSIAILQACAGDADGSEASMKAALLGGDVPEASCRARVQAVVASTLAGQKRIGEASRAFERALELASYGPTAADPAARALAVTGNNLAVELENRESLSAEETSLMLEAARAGRTYWAIAGGWMETERAEYRLAQSQLKAGQPAQAVEHARECLRIVEENGDDAGERVFGCEVMALACEAGGDRSAALKWLGEARAALPKIEDDGFRTYATEEIDKLGRKLG